ncbi:hypothetical protein AAVH_00966, partial [Aphelenchoides avenae]
MPGTTTTQGGPACLSHGTRRICAFGFFTRLLLAVIGCLLLLSLILPLLLPEAGLDDINDSFFEST